MTVRTLDFGRTRVRVVFFGMMLPLGFVQGKVATAVNAHYGLDGALDLLVAILIGGTFGLAVVGAVFVMFGRRSTPEHYTLVPDLIRDPDAQSFPR